MDRYLLEKVKEIREETNSTEVNYWLSKKWTLLKIVTTKKGFKYILGRTRKLDY